MGNIVIINHKEVSEEAVMDW